MGRSKSQSYSPIRHDMMRSPFQKGRHRDNDFGAQRKSWRERELGSRYLIAPTSLLVRNIARDSRPEDVRIPFERFGPIKDVYLPRDYYSGEPRGFGFVQYLDPVDAADAKYHMDRQFLDGREITVVFAEENRKKPFEMRVGERSSTPLSRTIHGGSRSGRFSGDKYQKQSPSHRFKSLSRSSSPLSRRHIVRDQRIGRDKCRKHDSSAKRSSSPEATRQGTKKSWSQSLSPITRSSTSKSHSQE